MTALTDLIDSRIRDIEDFPKPGVRFKDISPLLADPVAFGAVVEALAAVGRDDEGNVSVTKVAGMEARGFIFAAPVAQALGCGLVPVRKPGKLPAQTLSVDYDLEYGSATLQIHTDSVTPQDRVLLVDDVLATGGTARAATELFQAAGATVHALAVLMELSFLDGRAAMRDVPVVALRRI